MACSSIPHRNLVKPQVASTAKTTLLARNRSGFMSHLLRIGLHRGPQVFYLPDFLGW
jgi:hypothetical protein